MEERPFTPAGVNTILHGNSPPDPGDGDNGDFYIDDTAWVIYGPKSAGVWPAGEPLVGPQGPQGIQGEQGEQGIQGIQGEQGDQGPAGVGTPTGAILAFGGQAAPADFLLCDGASYLRATYPALFAVLGVEYGAADGTHFNVPDLRDRFPRGRATPSTPVASGGTATETLTSTQIPAHTHGVTGITVGSESAHTHGIGTYAAASESAHSHGIGTIAAAAEAAHTHGIGTIAAGSTNIDHWHYFDNYPSRYLITGYAPEVSSGSNAYHVNSYDRPQYNTYWMSSSQTATHAHTMSGSTGAGSSHTHTMSGSTGTGSAHTHTLSGSSGAGSAHTHVLSGATDSAGSGGSHNNLPPYLTVNYIIKT